MVTRSHKVVDVVPKFRNARNYKAYVNVVSAMYPALSPLWAEAAASYIWYARSQGRKWFFSPPAPKNGPWAAIIAHEQVLLTAYKKMGIFPIDPSKVPVFKPGTLAKYAKLVGASPCAS
jgi:hypothetical protein